MSHVLWSALCTSTLAWSAHTAPLPVAAPSLPLAELSAPGLTSYAPDPNTAPSDDPAGPSLSLATLQTSVHRPVSDAQARAISAELRRVVRQRIAHAQFCADTGPAMEPGATVRLELRVSVEGVPTLHSEAHPYFAACLGTLTSAWPLSADSHGTRTRVAFRVDAEAVRTGR